MSSFFSNFFRPRHGCAARPRHLAGGKFRNYLSLSYFLALPRPSLNSCQRRGRCHRSTYCLGLSYFLELLQVSLDYCQRRGRMLCLLALADARARPARLAPRRLWTRARARRRERLSIFSDTSRTPKSSKSPKPPQSPLPHHNHSKSLNNLI